MCDLSIDARLTSSSGVTGARDQSLESSQSDWSTKFCKLFLRVADKHRQIFSGKENCSIKNWTNTVESDLNQACVSQNSRELFGPENITGRFSGVFLGSREVFL